jgi:hypothetical protein
MIDVSHEGVRPVEGKAFAEAVTYSFADVQAGLFGVVRFGLSGGGRGSLLAVLFAGSEPVAAVAEGDLEVPDGTDWTDLSLPDASTSIEAPLERWRVRWDAGETAVDLVFEAASAPAELPAEVASAGGMEGYEQLCHVTGTVRVRGQEGRIDGLGQRGHSWGSPDWSRLELTRSVSVWLDDAGDGIVAGAVRDAGARGHDDEALWAVLVEHGEPAAIADPRLSTTYDGDDRQRRAGLELWASEEDGYPHRAAGEVICGSTLDLGSIRLDLAFLRWHSEGRDGIGRYDIVRKA